MGFAGIETGKSVYTAGFNEGEKRCICCTFGATRNREVLSGRGAKRRRCCMCCLRIISFIIVVYRQREVSSLYWITMKDPKRDISLGFTIIGALFVALLIKLCCFDIMIAEGESMRPTISSGRILFINKLAYGFRFPWSTAYTLRWAYPRIGDIIVFSSPQGTIAVKRCVQIEDGKYIIVLGENSEVSYDSRNYGPISADFVLGRVEGIR